MRLREWLRARRHRKARQRYEREKALRAAQQDDKGMERVADAGKMGGGLNVP